MQSEQVAQLLALVTRWAGSRSDVLGLALVGSQARGTAWEDSDIDLLFLVSEPANFRVDNAWLQEIQWPDIGLSVTSWRDTSYGVVWSRHVLLSDGSEVEFSFGAPSWASMTPMDPGTLNVIKNGWRVLLDRQGLLRNLAAYGPQPAAYR